MLEKKVVSQCISADYCRGWNDAVDKMPQWNNVADKLPFYNTTVLCMQLLVQPSLHEALKARATAEGCSVNELVHTLLEEALKEG